MVEGWAMVYWMIAGVPVSGRCVQECEKDVLTHACTRLLSKVVES